MPKRCGDPECANLVNERKISTVRLGDKVFCDDFCCMAWVEQNKKFTEAVDPFHEPMRRRTPGHMNGG